MAQKKVKNTPLSIAEEALSSYQLYVIVFLLWGLYLYFTFQTPDTGAQTFNISPRTLDLIRLTVAVPYLLIWLTASYSYTKIKRYAIAIRPGSEASAYNWIANGILALLVSLILSTILSTFRSLVQDGEQTRQILTILTNYAYVFPYLIAFASFFHSATDLSRRIINFKSLIKTYLIYLVPFVLFTYVWLEFIFTNPTRVVGAGENITPTYYLKDSLLVLSVIIPSLIGWALGISAAIHLRAYYQKVKGILFRRALSSLAFGFYALILGSSFLQALLSLGTQRLLNLGLTNLLILIYLFLVIQGLGFIFTARGASKLTEIERV